MNREKVVTRYVVESGESEHHVGYSDWRQVAGYFDGDGGEELKIGKFVLRFSITWTDTYLPQLQHIANFLMGEGLTPSKIKLGSSAIGREAWHLSLWEKGGMLGACKRMLPLLDKKRVQVKTLIDYLEDRITGDDVLRIFNREHAEGKWAGKVRNLGVPWKRSEGRSLALDAFVNAASSKRRAYSSKGKGGTRSPRTASRTRPS